MTVERLAAVLLALLLVAPGCTICPSDLDDTYSAYGGLYERADAKHGRVGSAFAPAEASLHDGEVIHGGEVIYGGEVIHEGEGTYADADGIEGDYYDQNELR